MFENVDLGTIIVRVKATDADSGLFAVIEYSLVDGEGKFGIKPSTVSYAVREHIRSNGHHKHVLPPIRAMC